MKDKHVISGLFSFSSAAFPNILPQDLHRDATPKGASIYDVRPKEDVVREVA